MRTITMEPSRKCGHRVVQLFWASGSVVGRSYYTAANFEWSVEAAFREAEHEERTWNRRAVELGDVCELTGDKLLYSILEIVDEQGQRLSTLLIVPERVFQEALANDTIEKLR